MAEAPEVHIGENSPEEVAYKLMKLIRANSSDQEKILDLYAECLATVKNPFARVQEKKRK